MKMTVSSGNPPYAGIHLHKGADYPVPGSVRNIVQRGYGDYCYCPEKDTAKLAEILGHSSIDTTRIYIMTTDIEHRKRIEQLGLSI